MIWARPRLFIKVTFLKHFALEVWVSIIINNPPGPQKKYALERSVKTIAKLKGIPRTTPQNNNPTQADSIVILSV